MFTGIIEEIGIIKAIKKKGQCAVITVGALAVLDDIKQGDSVAVNGICLTVISFAEESFCADIMHETVKRSNLWNLNVGDIVNLERAMPLNGRFGGHIVTGHIDGIGVISSICKDENAICFTIRTSPDLLKYVITKGSIAIDGISLTVVAVSERDFRVSVIPHTAKYTSLKEKRVGDTVNLENDCIGKYIEKLFCTPKQQSNISRELLTKHGF